MTGVQAHRPAFRDPKPTVERISQLAQRVLTGDILLPKFQRDFVWKPAEILRLLDSIARNYPIGGILLWQSKEHLASERTIADLAIAESKPEYPVNYLLDGQQRLSTICGVLYWKPGDPHSRWNVVYDLRSEKFLHLTTLDDPPLNQVPLRFFAEPAALFKRINALEDKDLYGRAEKLFNRLQEYMIAAVTLADMSIKDIAPIFERINSSGTPLTVVDLMRAATWSPTFDLQDAISDVLDVAANKGFGSIDRKTLLRSVSAAAGLGFAVDNMDSLRKKSSDELRDIFTEVTHAVRRSVDFLSTHVRIPKPEALPYINQFAVVTEIFRQLPSPSVSQSAALQRWFWKSTITGYFAGWNTGDMSRDVVAISNFASGAQEDIEVPKPLVNQDVWKLTQFRSNSAVSKMLAIILSYHSPVDLLTGQHIDPGKSLAWSNDKEFHHFFPRQYAVREGLNAARVNSAANIVLLTSLSNIRIKDRAPSAYLGDLIAEVGRGEVVRRAETLLVSEQALDAALQDDFEGFITARSATLQDVATKLASVDDQPEAATVEPDSEGSPDEDATDS